MQKWITYLSLGLLLSGCATTSKTPNPADPYEKFNRNMYAFNDALDRAILKPTATLYDKITPKPVHTGITNFFSNLDQVPTVANDLMQGNFYQATNDSWRFVINSTVGIVGFIDVGSRIGLEENHEDFGLTLGRWGYKNSNYLVLPFFGPSTVRDAVGLPVNWYLSIPAYIKNVSTRNTLFAISTIDRRANLLKFQSVMDQAALDKYTFLRDAYMQRRAYFLQRNEELGDPYLETEKEKVKEQNKNNKVPNQRASIT